VGAAWGLMPVHGLKTSPSNICRVNNHTTQNKNTLDNAVASYPRTKTDASNQCWILVILWKWGKV